MKVGAALRGGTAIVGIALALAACTPEGNGNDIASAFCNACPSGTTAKSYTAEDCHRFALEAQCQTWALDDPTIEGCSNSCTFADCKERVTCETGGTFPTQGPPER